MNRSEFGDTRTSIRHSDAFVLKKSRFTEWMVRKNSLDAFGFQEWAFSPGMLFNSNDKWWGNQGKREMPHEGLDLCFYRDRENRIHHLNEKTKIPVLYDGVIVRVMDDFIGKSVMVEHRFYKSSYPRFCTIYGHTTPLDGLDIGRVSMGGTFSQLWPCRKRYKRTPRLIYTFQLFG